MKFGIGNTTYAGVAGAIIISMARFDHSRSMRWVTLVTMAFLVARCGSHAAGSSSSDPLYLKQWLSNEPIPSHIVKQVQQYGSSTYFVERTQQQQQQQTSSSASSNRQLQQAIQANALNVRPGLDAKTVKPATYVTSVINPSVQGFGIPNTFLGISHEWTNIGELNQQGTYQQLLKDLTAYGGGPVVLRVGGGSTDRQTGPPSAQTFKELKQLQYSTGMMFIFGLNFKKGNVNLAKSQMDAVFANLPSYSIMSFELGNEPNFYEGMNGKTSREYIACCYVNDWEKFVRRVSCKKMDVFSTCTFGQFSGPAWGHVNMFPATMDWFLKVNYQYMNLVTVHWYKARTEEFDTVQSLLDEAPVRTEMANLKKLVAISRRYGKDLRVAEMNTISNSGRRGVSNSLAAALWTLDSALEVANTGAVGINLHWGDGLSLYAALVRQDTGAAYVKPPYYAYLMLQMALGKGSRLIDVGLKAKPEAHLKVWALQEYKSQVVRVVLINKHATAGAGVNIQLPGGYSDGKLIRLVGKQGLTDEWGTSLGNMTYNLGGEPFGVPSGEIVFRQNLAGNVAQEAGSGKSSLKYTVYMPAGSAALLTIPRQQ